MILFLLRITLGAALAYVLILASRNGETNLENGDLTNAFYMAVGLLLAVANAIVWAPLLGAAIAAPITGVLTDGSFREKKTPLIRMIRWADGRGYHRVTRILCFCQGVAHPWHPTGFYIGMMNSRPGTWWEKIYAREVFRFGNAQHCIDAYYALLRCGVKPRPHPSPEICIIIHSLEREPGLPPRPVRVPKFPPPLSPLRDPRIKLWDGADQCDESAKHKKTSQPPCF